MRGNALRAWLPLCNPQPLIQFQGRNRPQTFATGPPRVQSWGVVLLLEYSFLSASFVFFEVFRRQDSIHKHKSKLPQICFEWIIINKERSEKTYWLFFFSSIIVVTHLLLVCAAWLPWLQDWSVYSHGWGGVLNTEFGWGGEGFSWLNETNPDPVQETKDVHFATLSKRKCYNVLPCSRLDQALLYSRQKTVLKFSFSRISTEAHEISENYVVVGAGTEKICGADPIKTQKCETVCSVWQRALKMIPPAPCVGRNVPIWEIGGGGGGGTVCRSKETVNPSCQVRTGHSPEGLAPVSGKLKDIKPVSCRSSRTMPSPIVIRSKVWCHPGTSCIKSGSYTNQLKRKAILCELSGTHFDQMAAQHSTVQAAGSFLVRKIEPNKMMSLSQINSQTIPLFCNPCALLSPTEHTRLGQYSGRVAAWSNWQITDLWQGYFRAHPRCLVKFAAVVWKKKKRNARMAYIKFLRKLKH